MKAGVKIILGLLAVLFVLGFAYLVWWLCRSANTCQCAVETFEINKNINKEHFTNETFNNMEALMNTVSINKNLVTELFDVNDNSQTTSLQYPEDKNIHIGDEVLNAATLKDMLRNNVSSGIIMGTAGNDELVSVPDGTTIGNWDIFVIPLNLTNHLKKTDALQWIDVHATPMPEENKFKLYGRYQYRDTINARPLHTMLYLLVWKA